MVKIPPIPVLSKTGEEKSSPVLPKLRISEQSEEKPVIQKRYYTGNLYELLDKMKPEQQAELYIWLAEQPLPSVDPVRLAVASFNSLKEDELPLFFEQLKNSMSPDLWELLTDA